MTGSEALLAQLRAHCFPQGEAAGRAVRGIRNTQQGEFCTSPQARWTPFTATERMDAARSGFCWEARMHTGTMKWLGITDAYEGGHGYLALKLGGVATVRKITGPELDRGELQRYLAAVLYCPPMLLNNPALDWTRVGERTLRLRDRNDLAGASVELELGENGRPTICRAERPRLVGNQTMMTPWWAAAFDDRELEGMRVPSRFEAGWQLPEGPFPYIRATFTRFELVR